MIWLFPTAYLIGSVPTAYIVGRLAGRHDLRREGSRNVGATNAAKVLGPIPGLLALLGDMGKGYAAHLLGQLSSIPWVGSLCSALAVAGHNWPLWLGFHGGGGLATLVGGSLPVVGWEIPAAGLAIWGGLFLVIRDHDKSALLACLLMPLLGLLVEVSREALGYLSLSLVPVALARAGSICRKRVSERGRI